ncbi:MAG TPA: hypothetical protein VIT91_14890 [Chthoniobacterales bacterium]
MTRKKSNRTTAEIKAMMAEEGDFLRPICGDSGPLKRAGAIHSPGSALVQRLTSAWRAGFVKAIE